MKLTGEFKLFGNKITHWLGKVLPVILPVFTKNPYYLSPYLQNPCQYHFCRSFVFESLLLETVLKLSYHSCDQDKMGSCENSGLCSLVKRMIFVATCGFSVGETVLEFSHLWEPACCLQRKEGWLKYFLPLVRPFSPSSNIAAEPSLNQPLSSGVCWLGIKAGGRCLAGEDCLNSCGWSCCQISVGFPVIVQIPWAEVFVWPLLLLEESFIYG